jgi:hypothetical protein
MKTRIFTAIISCVAIASSFASAPDANSPYAYRVSLASTPNGEVLRGAYKSEVLDVLGAPSSRVSDSLWVYNDKFCVKDTELARSSKCTTLVVTFNGPRVIDMKLVNRAARETIVACAWSGKQVRLTIDDTAAVGASNRLAE